MKYFAWDAAKNAQLMHERKVSFEQVVFQILNGKLLDDPRVRVVEGDVFRSIKQGAARWDAILLDVDNGPTSFVQPQNSRIYTSNGLGLIRRALRTKGRVAFWSAEKEPAFLAQLSRSGFRAQEIEAKAHERAKRSAHRIYVGEAL